MARPLPLRTTLGRGRIEQPRLASVSIRGFSLGDVDFHPGSLSALVGESGAGKSNLLAAVRSLLDQGAPPSPTDLPLGLDGVIRVEGRLADGQALVVEADPAAGHERREGQGLPVLFLPARSRDGRIVDEPVPGAGPARDAARFLRRELAELTQPPSGASARSDAASTLALVSGIESCCSASKSPSSTSDPRHSATSTRSEVSCFCARRGIGGRPNRETRPAFHL